MNKKNILSVCDLETEEITHVPTPFVVEDHRPFGISWQGDRMFIAQPTSVFQLNKRLKNPVVFLHKLWYGIHQILVYDNYLWIVSPRLNAVKRVNLSDMEMNYFMPEDGKLRKRRPAEFYCQSRLIYAGDISHYNSILIRDDRLYLAAHNHDNPSFIAVYRYPDLKFIRVHQGMGRQIHNIFVEGDEIYTLDSLGSRAIVSTKNACIPVGLPGEFLRGLAVTESLFVVGSFPHSQLRHGRRNGDACLVLIDRRSKKVTRRIKIPNIGNINDIRMIDHDDQSHPVEPFWDRTFSLIPAMV